YAVSNELFVYLGSGGDTVNIPSTAPGLTTVLLGGVGNDTFNVGDSANTLSGIKSHLSFQIANPGSRVVLNDQGSAAPPNYTFARILAGGQLVPAVARTN